MKIFFDTEFTGLHQNTTLISIGLVAETGESFYAEFTDYNPNQVDRWIADNVLTNTLYLQRRISKNVSFLPSGQVQPDNHFWGSKPYVLPRLDYWLTHLAKDKIEMWSDCLAYDWVLFCELFGGAFSIPKNIYYIPFDLSTLFKIKGIDPDIDRVSFVGNRIAYSFTETPTLYGVQLPHNALFDAQIIKACYEKLAGAQ